MTRSRSRVLPLPLVSAAERFAQKRYRTVRRGHRRHFVVRAVKLQRRALAWSPDAFTQFWRQSERMVEHGKNFSHRSTVCRCRNSAPALDRPAGGRGGGPTADAGPHGLEPGGRPRRRCCAGLHDPEAEQEITRTEGGEKCPALCVYFPLR